MSTVSILAQAIQQAVEIAHPQLRKTILKKLPILIAAMLEARTANTTALATVLPLATQRLDMRLQWMARLLGNPLLVSSKMMKPFVCQLFGKIAASDQVLVLHIKQEKLGERFTLLLISTTCGNQRLPLLWRVGVVSANQVLWDWQRSLLEVLATWIPEKTPVQLRVEPSPAIMTPLDIQRLSHWSSIHIAPNEAQDSALPQGIDEILADWMASGASLQNTHLRYANRIDHLMLVIALALYWQASQSQPSSILDSEGGVRRD